MSWMTQSVGRSTGWLCFLLLALFGLAGWYFGPFIFNPVIVGLVV